MIKHLLTPSLLNSFSWYLKESFTKTGMVNRGNAFEPLVMAVLMLNLITNPTKYV